MAREHTRCCRFLSAHACVEISEGRCRHDRAFCCTHSCANVAEASVPAGLLLWGMLFEARRPEQHILDITIVSGASPQGDCTWGSQLKCSVPPQVPPGNFSHPPPSAI